MSNVKFRSILDLVKQFPDERSCHQYLGAQRWATGEIICPHIGCGYNECYVFSDGIRYKCKECCRQFTAKTNTFMGGSKLPTIKWLIAMYLIMHKKGLSSVQLSKDLNVTQTTAWFMLQRIRGSFVKDNNATKLSGTVEVDESWLGGRNKNRHHDKKIDYKADTQKGHWPDKVGMLGLLEIDGKLKTAILGNATVHLDVASEIYSNVEFGSTLHTDEWNGYKCLETRYSREKVDHSKGVYAYDGISTNAVENFWSHVKRCIPAIYISVSRKHVNKYLAECTFRYNYRKFDTQRQFEVMFANMECRLLYKELIAA